jgi:hypothetical protein
LTEGGQVNKDDIWREAPGYCVECGNLSPLNKSAICETCWEERDNPEPWVEDEFNSERFYQSWGSDALEELVRLFFDPGVMKRITSGYHKHRDGSLIISYNYFDEEWVIEHPGYVRGRIESLPCPTLREAILSFKRRWQEQEDIP